MTPPGSPDLSVLMVTAGEGWPLTARAIESLLPQEGPGCHLEIVLVDNGSPDLDAGRVGAAFPAVRYLRLERDLGFAVANNRGLALCRAPLVFILNNDTEVQPGALLALLEAASRHARCDLFAAQTIRLNHPDVVDNRGIYLDGTGHFRQLDTGAPAAAGPGPREIFGPSGCATLVRRSLLDRIGLFDEALGMYLEDGDFACRAVAAGARCLYVPAARVLHVGSATANRMADAKLYHIQRNMRVLRRRWLDLRPGSRTFWLAHTYEWLQLLRAIPTGHLATVLHAIRDARAFRSDGEHWATPDARRRVAAWIGVRERPLPCDGGGVI